MEEAILVDRKTREVIYFVFDFSYHFKIEKGRENLIISFVSPILFLGQSGVIPLSLIFYSPNDYFLGQFLSKLFKIFIFN